MKVPLGGVYICKATNEMGTTVSFLHLVGLIYSHSSYIHVQNYEYNSIDHILQNLDSFSQS